MPGVCCFASRAQSAAGSPHPFAADQNEGRDVELSRAGHIGARRVKSSSSLETGCAAGCDFERGVASLRKPDGRDPVGIDVRKAGQIGQSAIGVGQRFLEVDGASLLEAIRVAKSSTNRAT